MVQRKLNYDNKDNPVSIRNRRQQATAEDFNDIKSVVNANSDDAEARFSTLANNLNGYLPQGEINDASDFPTVASVQIGHLYAIRAAVTDNNATKTNTGLSFAEGVSIVWSAEDTWIDLGSNYVTTQQIAKIVNGSNYRGTVDISSVSVTSPFEGMTVIPIEDGSYPNFGGLTRSNEICAFVYKSSTWTKEVIKRDNYRVNFFKNNHFLADTLASESFPPVGEKISGVGSFSEFGYEDAQQYFGYEGRAFFANIVPSGLSNFFFSIPVNQFRFDNEFILDKRFNVSVEIHSPVAQVIRFRVFSYVAGGEVLKGNLDFTLSIGYNLVRLQVLLDDAFTLDTEFVELRFFPIAYNFANDTLRFGRIFCYNGSEREDLDMLDYDSKSPFALYDRRFLDEELQYKTNLNGNYNFNNFLNNGVPFNGVDTEKDIFLNPRLGRSNTWSSDVIQSDAFSRFGYIGKMLEFPILSTTTGNLLTYVIPSARTDMSSAHQNNRTLTFNIEFQSSASCVISINIFKVRFNPSFNFESIGEKSISLGTDTSIFSLNVPCDNTHDGYLIYFENVDASHYNNTIYMGRVLVSDDETSSSILSIPTDNVNINTLDFSHWYGKKMVTIGDSITFRNDWQPEIVRSVGVDYYLEEVINGLDGNSAMGVGGSTITPYITGGAGKNAGESIYYRADDVDIYNPELILLFGGQNDNLTSMGGDIPLGSISDTPYTGAEVSSDPPSFYASYKGTIEKILNQNPTALLILITPLWSGDQTYEIKKTKTDAIEEIGALYGLRTINLLETVGINSINQTSFLSDTVHPNSEGGVIIGTLIANHLK